MRKIIGVLGLVIGVLLLVWGHNIAQSVDSQVKQVFTGYYYIAGTVLGLFGLFQIFWPNKLK
jgi:Protein of unknown function (DUF3185)